MERIDVLYCSDLNYLEWSIISAASIAAFTKNVELHLHLFALDVEECLLKRWHLVLKKVNPACITHIHCVSDKEFHGLPTWRGGYGALLRFLAPTLIDSDWVLYLDGDTLAYRDVTPLWCLRNEQYWLMGHLNPSARFSEDGYGLISLEKMRLRYLNSGVLLMNLKALRENNFSNLWKQVLHDMNSAPKFPDQTLLNLLAIYNQQEDRRGILPNEWGVYSREGDKLELMGEKVGLVHYASDAPWVKNKSEIRDVDVIWNDFVERIAPILGDKPKLLRSKAARFRFFILSRIPLVVWRLLRCIKGSAQLEVHRGRLPYKRILESWNI